MKTILKSMIAVAAMLFFANANCEAQTAEVKVVVKGITEHKGNIMFVLGDKNKPQTFASTARMIPVTADTAVVQFENIPLGANNIYVFQDVNGNYTMDFTSAKLPAEPCAAVENIEVVAGKNIFEAILVDYSKEK